MLLLEFFIFCFIIGIGLLIIGIINWSQSKNNFLYWHDDDFKLWGSIIATISGVIVVFMSIVAIGIQMEGPAELAKKQETYNALIYKMNSSDCRDEFGLLNTSICNEIQYWNENLAFNKEMQKNIYIGCFYPKIYDQLEFIDLKGIQYKSE